MTLIERSRPWLRDDAGPDTHQDPLAAFLGPLEIRVLECLWQTGNERTVRGLLDRFPELAYTTVMTTLDRLFKKGLLDRSRRDRAYCYRPRFDRAGLERQLAEGAFDRLLRSAASRRAARPILATFIEAVARRDGSLLRELERMIRARRRRRPSRAGGWAGGNLVVLLHLPDLTEALASFLM
jgi:predicted transcriptional regulator